MPTVEGGGIQAQAEAQKAKLAAQQKAVQQTLDDQYAQLVANLQPQIALLQADMQAMTDAGAPIPPAWLLQQSRMSGVLSAINNGVNGYAIAAQVATTDAQHEMASAGARDATTLMQAALEPAAQQLGVDLTYSRPPVAALKAMAGRASNGAPLGTLFDGFGAEAASAAKTTLLLGTSLGTNPRAIAETLANDLGVSRNRASTIARTEMMGAYRDATIATYRQNSDLINGWMWLASLSPRTCAECLSMDGQVFTLDEEFDSHPQCRCTQVPLTRGWGDILSDYGVDASDFEESGLLDELDGEAEDATVGRETGTQWFAKQSAEVQAGIVGKGGQEAIAAGEIELKDFVGVKEDPVWGTTRYQRSLKEALTPQMSPERLAQIRADFAKAADEFNQAMREGPGGMAFKPGAADYTVSYQNERVKAFLAQKAGREWTPDELAGLTAAPPGSTIEVSGGGQILATYPDGTRMSIYLNQDDAGVLSIELQSYGVGDLPRIPYSAAQIQQIADQAEALDIHELTTKARTITDPLTHLNGFDEAVRLPGYGFDAPVEEARHESAYHTNYENFGTRAPRPPDILFQDGTMLSEALKDPEAAAWWEAYGNAPRLTFDTTPGSASMAQLERAVADEKTTAALSAAKDIAQAANDAIANATFSTARIAADQLEQESTRLVNALAPHGYVSDTAIASKKQVAQDLAARLADDPAFMQVGDRLSQLMANDTDLAREYREFGALATPEDVAAALVHAWSAGTDSLFPALQQAVKDEFGLSDLARLPNTKVNREALAQWKDVQPGLRSFVRQMYNNTQDWLKANGITDLPVYRGMGFSRLRQGITTDLLDGQPHEIQMALRAASSFSADANTALGFAGSPVTSDIADLPNHELVLAARVPAALVLSTAQTGFGALGEHEVVTLGGTFDAVVTGVDNKAFYRGSFEDIVQGRVTLQKITSDQVNALLAQDTPRTDGFDILPPSTDPLATHATTVEAQDWLTARLADVETMKLPGVSVDFMRANSGAKLDALPDEAARYVAQATAKLLDALPEVQRQLASVELSADVPMARVPRDGVTLLLSPEQWSDLPGLAQKASEYAASGWWTSGSATPEGIITHEFGHLVQLNYHIDPYNEWQAAIDRVAAAGGNPIVSTYAGSNVEEAFAETFALLARGTPTAEQMPIVSELANILSAKGIDYNALRASVGAPPLVLESATAGGASESAIARAARDAAAQLDTRTTAALEALTPEELQNQLTDATDRLAQLSQDYSTTGQAASDAYRELTRLQFGGYPQDEIAAAYARYRATSDAQRPIYDAWKQAKDEQERLASLVSGKPAIKYSASDDEATLTSILGSQHSESELAQMLGAQPGDTVRISSSAAYYHDGVRIELTTGDATQTHLLYRTPDGPAIHTDFVRNDAEKTASSGRDIVRSMQQMQELGITRITALAYRDMPYEGGQFNGYYTWARLGFTGDIPPRVLRYAQAAFGQDVTRVEQLMVLKGGPQWWKAHGYSFDATFDFTPGSYSMQTLARWQRMLERTGGEGN